jgi:hypothetical protein
MCFKVKDNKFAKHLLGLSVRDASLGLIGTSVGKLNGMIEVDACYFGLELSFLLIKS